MRFKRGREKISAQQVGLSSQESGWREAGREVSGRVLSRSLLNAPGLPFPLYEFTGHQGIPALQLLVPTTSVCHIPASEMGSLQNRKVLFYLRGTNLNDPRTQTPKSSSLRLGFNGLYGIKNKMISGVEKTVVTRVN